MVLEAQQNAQQLLSQARRLAQVWRDTARATDDYHAGVVRLSTATVTIDGQEVPVLKAAGFSDTPGSWPAYQGGDGVKTEIDWFLYLADVLGTLSAIVLGRAGQDGTFDFVDALVPLTITA